MTLAAWRRVAGLGFAAALLAGCTPAADRKTESSGERGPSMGRIGGPAPALESQTLDGRTASLAGLAGRPVLLNVWATWCHPCQDEIPVLEELHRRYAPAGLQVVGVSIDDRGRADDIHAFARRFGMTYPIWHDADQRVMPRFSVVGVPTTFLIGQDGRLAWRKTGEVKPGEPALLAALDSLLGGSRDGGAGGPSGRGR